MLQTQRQTETEDLGVLTACSQHEVNGSEHGHVYSSES